MNDHDHRCSRRHPRHQRGARRRARRRRDERRRRQLGCRGAAGRARLRGGRHLAAARRGTSSPGRSSGCCSLEDFHDAARVADALGVPHYVFDMREAFARDVIAPFVEEYLAGPHAEPVHPLQPRDQVRRCCSRKARRARRRVGGDRPLRAPRAQRRRRYRLRRATRCGQGPVVLPVRDRAKSSSRTRFSRSVDMTKDEVRALPTSQGIAVARQAREPGDLLRPRRTLRGVRRPSRRPSACAAASSSTRAVARSAATRACIASPSASGAASASRTREPLYVETVDASDRDRACGAARGPRTLAGSRPSGVVGRRERRSLTVRRSRSRIRHRHRPVPARRVRDGSGCDSRAVRRARAGGHARPGRGLLSRGRGRRRRLDRPCCSTETTPRRPSLREAACE